MENKRNIRIQTALSFLTSNLPVLEKTIILQKLLGSSTWWRALATCWQLFLKNEILVQIRTRIHSKSTCFYLLSARLKMKGAISCYDWQLSVKLATRLRTSLLVYWFCHEHISHHFVQRSDHNAGLLLWLWDYQTCLSSNLFRVDIIFQFIFDSNFLQRRI